MAQPLAGEPDPFAPGEGRRAVRAFRPAIQGGVDYDFGNNLSTSAMISGAQNSKTEGLGKTRLILGVSQSF